MSHHEHIETAFIQLSFTIKLWHFLDAHPIDKDLFDIDLTIQDPGSRVCLRGGEFHTYCDMQLAAENGVSIAFGAAAITLWEAIREYSGLTSSDLDPQASRKHNLAALSYMVRCCFAHGTAVPVWSIHQRKYRTRYRVGRKIIDLTAMGNGQPFTYLSIGGYETLWLLRDSAHQNGLL